MMASFSDIQKRLTQLADDTLWSIAEMICDLETEVKDKGDQIENLEKLLAEAEAQL